MGLIITEPRSSPPPAWPTARPRARRFQYQHARQTPTRGAALLIHAGEIDGRNEHLGRQLSPRPPLERHAP